MALAWNVDESSVQGNRMHLRGWCFEERMPIQRVEVLFSSPLPTVHLVRHGLPSPDLAKARGPGAALNRFDEWIDLPPGVAGREFRLQFTLGDGTIVLGNSVMEDADGRGPAVARVPSSPSGYAGAPIPGDAASLRAEIAAVMKREAEFKGRLAEEFADRGEGNTYLHTLREEIGDLNKRQQDTFAELELLVRKLEAEEARVAVLAGELDKIQGSKAWRVTAPLRAAARFLWPDHATTQEARGDR